MENIKDKIKNEVLETENVQVRLEFCAQTEDGEDAWYFHRFSNYPERELGGSYDRHLAFKRYSGRKSRLEKTYKSE